jgi:hypothetical protein
MAGGKGAVEQNLADSRSKLDPDCVRLVLLEALFGELVQEARLADAHVACGGAGW